MSLYLAHHGIKGMKWGVRRYQNFDGSYTSAGRKRYGFGDGKPYYSLKKRKGLSKKTKKALKIGLAVAGTAAIAYGGYKFATSEKGREIISNIFARNNPKITEVPAPKPNITEMINKAVSVGTGTDNQATRGSSNLKLISGGGNNSSASKGSTALKLLSGSDNKSINKVSGEFKPQNFKHIQLQLMDADGKIIPGPKIPADGKAYAEAYAKYYSNGSKESYKQKYDYIVKLLKRYGSDYYSNVNF